MSNIIKNTFMLSDVPLSEKKHRLYKILPPELSHATAEGLTADLNVSFLDVISPGSRGDTAVPMDSSSWEARPERPRQTGSLFGMAGRACRVRGWGPRRTAWPVSGGSDAITLGVEVCRRGRMV